MPALGQLDIALHEAINKLDTDLLRERRRLLKLLLFSYHYDGSDETKWPDDIQYAKKEFNSISAILAERA